MSGEGQLIDDLEQTYQQLMGRFGVAGGGGGRPPPASMKPVSDDNGSMEARVTAIENRLDKMDERLTRVEIKLDHITEEVTNVKWYLLGAALTIVVTVIGTVIGTGYGIQQMTVQTFQAAGQERAAQAPAQSLQPIVIQLPAQQQAPAPAK
jgi:hypothetical protein